MHIMIDDSILRQFPDNSPIRPLDEEAISHMLNRALSEIAMKQDADTPPVVSEKVKPAGQPLEPWGDREVEISPEDIAAAIREWDERVPEAAGVLTAGERG